MLSRIYFRNCYLWFQNTLCCFCLNPSTEPVAVPRNFRGRTTVSLRLIWGPVLRGQPALLTTPPATIQWRLSFPGITWRDTRRDAAPTCRHKTVSHGPKATSAIDATRLGSGPTLSRQTQPVGRNMSVTTLRLKNAEAEASLPSSGGTHKKLNYASTIHHLFVNPSADQAATRAFIGHASDNGENTDLRAPHLYICLMNS